MVELGECPEVGSSTVSPPLYAHPLDVPHWQVMEEGCVCGAQCMGRMVLMEALLQVHVRHSPKTRQYWARKSSLKAARGAGFVL